MGQAPPCTCPHQQGRYSPSKHSRAQPGSCTVTAPLARLAAGKIGRSSHSQVQAVIPGATRGWCGSGEPSRTPGLTSCRAQSARRVQRPEQEPMVFTSPAGALAARVGWSSLRAKPSVQPPYPQTLPHSSARITLKTTPPSSLQIPPQQDLASGKLIERLEELRVIAAL